MLIDSHCHLDKLDLSQHSDLDAAIKAAQARGVEHMLCVNIHMEDYQQVLDIAEQYPFISASVGVHPCYGPYESVSDDGCSELEPSVATLCNFAKHDKVVAIGETGLDYFRSKKDADMTWQQERFRRHIQAGIQTNKPIIIHTREARDDTIRIMQEENAQQCRGVMHCFTETLEMAKQAMDLDFYISISGIVTFKNAEELREVVRYVPIERLLVETDSPYLAPMPYRGKPNEPAYVREVAEYVATLKGVSYEKLIEVTGNNFFSLFHTAQRTGVAA